MSALGGKADIAAASESTSLRGAAYSGSYLARGFGGCCERVNEAALNMYRQAWLNNAEYFEASTRYLQLADKATRTLVMLTERLDQHRGRGQQQIVVKHVTVNADQAVVTDTFVTGKPAGNAEPSPALLANAAEKAMPVLDKAGKPQPAGGTKSR